MPLFTVTNTIEEFKCASSQKKTYINPNGGKIEICAKWGSQELCQIIEAPKFLWSSGYKMPITLKLIPPEGKFVKKDTVEFKAGAEDFAFTAEWIDEAPPALPKVDDAFGESKMSKPLSAIEQQGVDLKHIIEQNNMIMSMLGDLANK